MEKIFQDEKTYSYIAKLLDDSQTYSLCSINENGKT
jgi:hypothetical protein